MKAAPAARSLPWLASLAAASVIAPLLAWHPGALDDVRLDQGVLACVAVLMTLGLALGARRAPAAPPGSLLLLLGLACGCLALPFLPWREVQPGLADRVVLLSGCALAGVAAAGAFEVERMLRWTLGGCTAVSLLALAIGAGFDPLGWEPWPGAPAVAPYTGLNHAAELLTLLLVAAAVLLPTPRWRSWLWPALAVCAFHAGTLGTLAGRLALACGLALGAWRQPASRTLAAWIAGLFLVGEAARAMLSVPAAPASAETVLPPSLAIRKELYLAAAQHVPRVPLGIGLGRFEADYPEWRSPEEARLATNDWQARIFRSPKSLHNDPLQFFLECGWLGGALVLAGMLLMVRASPAWFHAPLLALGVHAVTRSPLLDNPPALALFALLLGCAARAGANLLASAEPRRSRAASLLISVGAMVALLPARGDVVGELEVARALDSETTDDARALARATSVRPWDARAWELRGLLGYLPAGEWQEARACFEQALACNPAALGALTGLIQVEMSAPDGDRSRGLQLLARAERLAGRHPAVRGARAGWLASVAAAHRGEGEKARAALRPDAGAWLLSAGLAEARALLLQGDGAGARAALQRAAPLAAEHRARLERVLRLADLAEPVVAELTARIFPGWPEDLTVAPPG